MEAEKILPEPVIYYIHGVCGLVCKRCRRTVLLQCNASNVETAQVPAVIYGCGCSSLRVGFGRMMYVCAFV